MEYVILVNEKDEIVGSMEKLEAHVQGKLHRAFSIFIYDRKKKQMLIHQRAFGKYHSGGLWTNACCSHPRDGEDILTSLHNRLKVELGLDMHFILETENNNYTNDSSKIYECGKFHYFADFKTITEHELDRVFLLYMDKQEISTYCKEEINDLEWIDRKELEAQFINNPNKFTAWVKKAYDLIPKEYLE